MKQRCHINTSEQQANIFQQALSQMKQGAHAQAADTCNKGLIEYPDDAKMLCLAAQSSIALKRFEEAKKLVAKAKVLHPNFSIGHEVDGDLLLLEGKFEAAIKAYNKALAINPDRLHLNRKITRANQLIAKLSAASGSSTNAFAKEMTQARQFEREAEYNKAEKIYRDILRRDPNQVEAIRLLASHATRHHQDKEAETFLRHAVSIAPDYGRLWIDLSANQIQLGVFQEAVDCANKGMALLPNTASPYISLGNAQIKNNQAELAIESYRKALAVRPGHEGAYSGLAHQLKTIGRQEEAIATHRENIAANPNNTESYWNLANMKTFHFEQHEVEAMQSRLTDEDLSDLGKTQLTNALGLEFETRKDYQAAFNYFRQCNQVQRQLETYDPVNNEVNTDTLIELYTPDFIKQHSGHGITEAAPIFIVGLPRSGSTLLEQILASHSQVEGTHELSELDLLVKTFPRANAERKHYPETQANLTAQGWTKLGDKYIEQTRKYRSDKVFFIDKNPNNFKHIGALQLAIPNAKIINAKRHPLDSCFGSYKQLFASGQPFSYDLTEIGEYYLSYQKLMEHWHKVLPGKVLDVNYEEVVANLEQQVKRILAHCDLPFEQNCLDFHNTQRAVKTASSEQVRKPIYSSSVNLWRNYEPYLEELIEVMEPLLEELPETDRPG